MVFNVGEMCGNSGKARIVRVARTRVEALKLPWHAAKQDRRADLCLAQSFQTTSQLLRANLLLQCCSVPHAQFLISIKQLALKRCALIRLFRHALGFGNVMRWFTKCMNPKTNSSESGKPAKNAEGPR